MKPYRIEHTDYRWCAECEALRIDESTCQFCGSQS